MTQSGASTSTIRDTGQSVAAFDNTMAAALRESTATYKVRHAALLGLALRRA